jgi:hypothetical protein
MEAGAEAPLDSLILKRLYSLPSRQPKRLVTELHVWQFHILHLEVAGISQQVQSGDRKHNTKNIDITFYRWHNKLRSSKVLASSTRAEEYPRHTSQLRAPVCHPPTTWWKRSPSKTGAKGGGGNNLT